MKVSCVRCRTPFQQSEAKHLEHLAERERWTCSKKCEDALVQMAQGGDPPAGVSVEEETPAEQGREAIRVLQGGASSPAQEDESEQLIGADSNAFECLAAAGQLANLANDMSGSGDKYVLAQLSRGYIDRAIDLIEATLDANAVHKPPT